MNEIWKDIKWYNNVYSVSNLWRIKNKKYNKILKWTITNSWYRCITLSKIPVRVHRLVASAFLWLNLKFTGNNLVCHKNDIRDDNRLENLFLWTHKDNAEDKVKKWRAKWSDSNDMKLMYYLLKKYKEWKITIS